MNWKDLHINSANLIGFTLIGVLASTFTSQWWSCADGSLDVFRAWALGSILFFTGIGATVVIRHYGYSKQLQYYIELTLRIMIIYAIVTTALLKAEGHFYNYTLFEGETKLADLEANTFANAFFGFSPIFQSYVGYAVLLSLALISFRQSQRLGNLLLGGILVNAVMLNYSFDSCFIFKNSIYLSVVSFFVYCDLPRYFSFFTNRKQISEDRYHPLSGHNHLNNSAAVLKMALLTGLFFYNQSYIEDTKNYRTRNVDSPITGVWDITDIEYSESKVDNKDRETLQSFKSIILDKGRFGAVKINDTLSFFEYLIVPEYNQLEIWNFQDYYDLDIKGRYQKISNDSMIYIGRNNRDSLKISLKKQE